MRTSLACWLAAGIALCGTSAQAQSQKEIRLAIKGVLLADALNDWAQAAGLRLRAATSHRYARQLNGSFTPQGALDCLLDGTALDDRTVIVREQAESAWSSASFVKQHSLRLAAAEMSSQSAAITSDRPPEATRAQSVSAPSVPQRGPMEEVVVSAQKREERLQEVPMSISVLGGTDLDTSTAEGVTEALSRVPGVAASASFQGGGTQAGIRGVTAGGPLFTGSSPVGYYLDSIPFGLVKSAIAPDANAYDLERVEVLRGPQGTLYGASAQNGVLRVLTRDAQLDQFEFKARTSASSTDGGGANYRGDMALNVPLVQGKLAARAVVGYQTFSGWIDKPNHKDANDAEIKNFRLKISGQATERLSVGLSAWLSRSDYGAPSQGDDQGRNSSLIDEPIATDYDAFGLKIGYDAPTFSISSMTSYLEFKNAGNLDLTPTGSPAVLFTGLDAEVLAQEVIVNSTQQSAWRWSAGVFYRDAEDRLRQNSLDGGAPFDYSNGSKSYALFGEFGRRFLDNHLAWTLGVRHFHDEVFVKENINQGQPGDLLQDNRDSFDSTTPRAVLTWYPDEEDATVYISYSEGFRSGFDQDPGVKRPNPNFPPAKPDKLRNYELGAKLALDEGRVSLESAVYFIDWRDVQQSIAVPFGGTSVTALVNGESASGIGVDLGLNARASDNLSVGFNVSWNDLTMDSAVISGGEVLFSDGDRLNLSPEITAGAWADYSFSVGRGYGTQFSLSANYTSEKDWRTIWGGAQSVGYGDSLLIGRASIALIAPDHWVATLFADNLTNENGKVAIPPFPVIADWASRVRPRTVGAQLEYRF